tara:strand:+ start:165 stop:398 length:234 start_codon:yes stop_codon:yes gene_type:complete
MQKAIYTILVLINKGCKDEISENCHDSLTLNSNGKYIRRFFVHCLGLVDINIEENRFLILKFIYLDITSSIAKSTVN